MTSKLVTGSALEGSGEGWGGNAGAGTGSGTGSADRMLCRKDMAHDTG